MLRHYYVTLCGDYFGQCVDICATDKESSVTLTEKGLRYYERIHRLHG